MYTPWRIEICIHELRLLACSSGDKWEDTGLDGEASVSNQSHGEDLEALLADAEHFYGQAYYRYLAIQQQTREDIEGALPSLGQASTTPPEQVQGYFYTLTTLHQSSLYVSVQSARGVSTELLT